MDFFGDVFGSSASKALIDGLNRVVGDGLSAQDWFAPKEVEETPVRLPWQPLTPEEQGYERQLRDAVLLICQSPQIFLQDASIAANQLPADIFASAGAVLEADEGLRQLRFRLVPKYCSEEQFWNRYFAAVERVKQQVKTEQMWGDFDMLDSDGIEPSDPAGSSSRQVELPSMRQPANATDTMSNMVLSGQSSASAHTVLRAERPKPAVVHSARPVRINCKQASKAQAAEQRSERMVMSGDLGSQASSVTENLLMSPRSMDSTATKVPACFPSPAGPSPIGPSPMGTPSVDHSPMGPSPAGLSSRSLLPVDCASLNHPLSPVFPATKSATGTAAAALVLGTHGSQPAQATLVPHCLGPDLLQTDNSKEGIAVAHTRDDAMNVVLGGAGMSLPFKAASLQQLADAAVNSKRVETMRQLVDDLSAITKRNSSDRAATVAWQLFNPMHVDAHSQICSASNGGQGISLAGSIATAMCEMKDTAEMAMLWLEVMQEVESHWISGRSLPDEPSARMSDAIHETMLNNCLASVNAAIAVRQRSVHTVQAADVQGMAQQGSQALDKLQRLPPRQVFEQLFTVKACLSLSAAASMASRAGDNDVLQSGVREVHHLTISALSQPSLSKHQLTKLCQVFNKLEVMFQVAIEQNSLRQQTQQQAAWIATAAQQDIRACSPDSTCSVDHDPTWSDLDYESWTLL
ncbi:TPA: hypothetical protein ACH3X2_010086 [Trebouxia sp. C0005]